MKDRELYALGIGTVQPYIVGPNGFFKAFGHAQYDRSKPVLTDSLKQQGNAVCEDLNNGEISPAEAIKRLRQIYF